MSHVSSVALMWRLNEYRYGLVGVKCTVCNNLYFPPKALCPNCRRGGAIMPHKFSGVGEVETYTIIHSAPEGFEYQVPYVVAIIRIDGGVRVSGQLVDVDVNKLKENELIGKKVSTVFRKYYEDGVDGLIQYGLKWKVDAK